MLFRSFSPKVRNTVAFHEAGHAVIGIKLKDANIVEKVTIIPRGKAGGYNLMLPSEEQTYLSTKDNLLDQITGLLGGRVAEEIVFDEVSTGAQNDLQKSTAIARSMVTEYGMSENLGPVTYEHDTGTVFLGRDYAKDKNFSEAVAMEIDKEIRNIIGSCHDKATEIINKNIDLLKLIAHYLLEVETLTRQDIDEIVSTGRLARWDDRKPESAGGTTIEEPGEANPEDGEDKSANPETPDTPDTPDKKDDPDNTEK